MGGDRSESLAVERTFLAYERTLMAWVRTSASLISFGFTIYKFFAYLAEVEGVIPPHRGFGPRTFAIGMISVGVVALGLAVLQQRRAFKLLDAQSDTKHSSLAQSIAGIMAFGGLWLLIVVLFRL